MSSADAAAAARHELDARLDRAFVLAVLALATRNRLADSATAFRLRLSAIDEHLAALSNLDRPMTRLVARLGLTDNQLEFLWTAVAFSADPRIVPHAEALGGPSARRGLSVAVHAELVSLSPADGFDLAVWLAAPNVLSANGLLGVAEDTHAPSSRPYVVPTRLLQHLAGVDSIEPGLRAIRPLASLATRFHDDIQRASIETLVVALGAHNSVVVVEGPQGSGRALAVATASARPLVALECDALDRSELGSRLLGLRRECCLTGAIAVIADADRVLGEGASSSMLGRYIDTYPETLVLTSSVAGLDLVTRRAIMRVRWTVPDTATRLALWRTHGALGGVQPTGDLETLALRYRVGPGAIVRAVEAAEAFGHAAPLTSDVLAAGLHHSIAERMGGLARRVEVTQTWDDLVLGDDTLDQVHALVARVRHAHQVLELWGYKGKMARGTGVPALFSGPPGTGKTMVAGLIARELDLELYQVDLSQVVSKWVGETEKQLARVFDAAEQGHGLLLFDEADALFAQRSAEVKSAVDRYANLEVNFLLQRIEAFGGITILTTNLDASIDRALKRRLAAHIVFTTPDEDERTRLWERMSSTALAPVAKQIDFEGLARVFPTMTGANIRNAAISAAFLAAGERAKQITYDHMIRAGRAEYRSMGHMLAESGGRGSAGKHRS